MRMTDLSFDRKDISTANFSEIERIAAPFEVRVVSSSIQIHLFTGEAGKGLAVLKAMSMLGLSAGSESVLTMGDSTNDESLLDPARFPVSAGVANIRDFADRMRSLPTYVATSRGAEGAMEILGTILSKKMS